MTQIKRRPPTFVLQVSRQPEELGDDYLRYLMNRPARRLRPAGRADPVTMRKPRTPSRGTRMRRRSPPHSS